MIMSKLVSCIESKLFLKMLVLEKVFIHIQRSDIVYHVIRKRINLSLFIKFFSFKPQKSNPEVAEVRGHEEITSRGRRQHQIRFILPSTCYTVTSTVSPNMFPTLAYMTCL